MPWFRKSTRSKKHRITKKDISEPTDFKHCYHAILDVENDGLSGLPPQWSTFVEFTADKKVILGERTGAMTSNKVLSHRKKAAEKLSFNDDREYHPDNINICKPNIPSSCTSEDLSSTSRASQKDNSTRNQRSSSKSSIASTSSTLSFTKRPSPIVRGSDASLEDTIKSIRKHCENMSNESVQEEEVQTSYKHRFPPMEREIVRRGRFHSRARPGSLMQLRSSPINRKHITSYTSDGTGTMTQSNDRLPSSSAFCLSAPSEVIQSDLGLYEFYKRNELCNSSLSQHCVNSPSGSSGYFGSSGSSLCNSRVFSVHQIPTTSTTPLLAHPNYPIYRPSDLHVDADCPETVPLRHSASHQHRFYSLHRRLSTLSPGTNPMEYHRHTAPGHGSGGGVVLRGGALGLYGTRSHRTLHNTYSSCYPTSETENAHRMQEQAYRIQERTESRQRSYNHEPFAPSTSSGYNSHKQEKRNSRLSSDQFRMTLELLVNPANPREEYVDFVKIGEGSTGLVYTAREVSTNRVVAVKKMNLWKQQRKELLFNEVSEIYNRAPSYTQSDFTWITLWLQDYQ